LLKVKKVELTIICIVFINTSIDMLVTPDIKFHLLTMLSLINFVGIFVKRETTSSDTNSQLVLNYVNYVKKMLTGTKDFLYNYTSRTSSVTNKLIY